MFSFSNINNPVVRSECFATPKSTCTKSHKGVKPMIRSALLGAFVAVTTSNIAYAEVPISFRLEWVGPIDVLAVGAPLAADSNMDGTVDTLQQSASVTVTAADLPAGAILQSAQLYWAGSIIQAGASCDSAGIDDEVELTPSGESLITVTADASYCTDAGSMSYDISVNRADVTGLMGSLTGTHTVANFAARASGAGTDNASFSLVFVYAAPSLPKSKINLYDGVETFASSSRVINLTGFEVDSSLAGSLTWYVLDGDTVSAGTEQVTVSGQPGAAPSITLQDMENPATNPMNHTMNTQSPVRTDAIGVDLDVFDISAALAVGDTSIDVNYSAGTDRWWLAYQLVQVGVISDADISVAPSTLKFGDVQIGTSVGQEVTIDNIGTMNDLVVADISVSGGGGAFAITDVPILPIDIATTDVPPGVEVTFTPPSAGLFNAQLRILSDDFDESVVYVALEGNGVAVEPPPSDALADIIAFFDSGIEAGTLFGSGPGQSPLRRPKAFRNMLLAAGDLIDAGQISDACQQLQDAVNRTDDSPRPPDFVAGSDAGELASKIYGLMDTLSCDDA